MPVDGSSYLTTGQAARLCSVTPDTILKWIKRGRLAGTRTAGGHYRVERRDLEPYIPAAEQADQRAAQNVRARAARFPHCWELFTDNGTVREDCEQCVVYKVGAERCFVMAGLGVEVGHSRHFCQSSCDECVYYRRVQGLATDVLLITPDDNLIHKLSADEHERVSLRFAHGGYEASAILHDFRPAFVAIDVELLLNGEAGLLESLSADARIPGMRVILLATPGIPPQEVSRLKNGDVVGVLRKPFSAQDIAAVISRHEVDSGMLSCADPWVAVGAVGA
jgi:excisionase family DNA binding protein